MKYGQRLTSLVQARRRLAGGWMVIASLFGMAPAASQDWMGRGSPRDHWVTSDDDAYVEDDGDHDSSLSMPATEWEASADIPGHCQAESHTKCPGVCLDPGFPAKPKRKLPGDIDEGDCPSQRYRTDDRIRSGDPNCVYRWATPSVTDKYSAWYVGGGAAFKGRGRTAAEGTWGLDYDGLFGHARTWLNYTCGKRQGGEGAYEGEHVPLKKKLSSLH